MKLSLLVLAVAAVLGTAYTSSQSSSSSSATSSSSSSSVNIIKVISGLTGTPIANDDVPPLVNDEKTDLPYHRTDWEHWIDSDHDCQNTRVEILIDQNIDLTKIIYNNKQTRCSLQAGEWLDPYSNTIYHNPIQMDIDHIVPLSWAHKHGAAEWPKEQKRTFANDSDNLLAVYFKLNREKGDKGLDVWLPPNHAYRCTYINRFNRIVMEYHLHYTNSEYRVVKKLLDACK